MGVHLLLFVGVAAIIIVVPGPDTAVVTKNVLLHGRRTALATSLGVACGIAVWTIAAAVGVASLLRASEVAFTTLKIAGALYLAWLGLQALRASRRIPDSGAQPTPATGRHEFTLRGGFRQGLLSDLANPKIGVFFTGLLPQFVDPGQRVLVPFLGLGAVFVAMTVAWLTLYCLVTARAAGALQRPRIRAWMDRITGVVLIAIGLRLATERP
ncbi:MAG: LysE family translocator [Solirubrobacteraceae bacterium]